MKTRPHFLDPVFRVFGGVPGLSAALGLPTSTVQYWRASGRIPPRNWDAVLAAARARGLPVGPFDLIPIQIATDNELSAQIAHLQAELARRLRKQSALGTDSKANRAGSTNISVINTQKSAINT